jgi:hypothetical protein
VSGVQGRVVSLLGIYPEARRAPLPARQHLEAFVRLDAEATRAWNDRRTPAVVQLGGGYTTTTIAYPPEAWAAYHRIRRLAVRHKVNATVLMLESGLRAIGGVA